MSLLTAWQFLIDLGHNETNPLQPRQHVPVPLAGKTVLVNGAQGRRTFRLTDRRLEAHVTAVASGGTKRFCGTSVRTP
jgi:hypothetical protein